LKCRISQADFRQEAAVSQPCGCAAAEETPALTAAGPADLLSGRQVAHCWPRIICPLCTPFSTKDLNKGT